MKVKRGTRRRSFKNLFLDLSITKKHDQTESSNDENIAKPNVHNSANTPTSLKALSTNSISSKNSETESSDIDYSDQKNSKSMKKRRKSFKDIFQDLKTTISRDNTESEKSGTSSPANTLSPTCDKGESKSPDKPKTESYISRIKHIFESSENLLQKSDNSENHSAKILHENEDYNKQENHIQILEAINKIRKKHNAHTLTLSKELCDMAIERAENLASGIAGHLQNDIGENIFMHGLSGTSLKLITYFTLK
ncbi:hypothetical protein Avbf_14881 [Armadillidium vulgare]|nr:hypothetical protein Avbf_14881 [Armadillidium vulgare]